MCESADADTRMHVATALRRLSRKVDGRHLNAVMQAGADALAADLPAAEVAAALKAALVMPPAGDVPAVIAQAIRILESGGELVKAA